jgi:gamma-glutamylcyclotransferase (GGCT)/AIG2-like uncharacterized protein YtfP
VLYFAYGSNMLVARLRHPARAPHAELVETATLAGHRLLFHKRGRDGSAKADAFAVAAGEAAAVVHGVLYRITAGCRDGLDRVEGVGRGYRAVEIEVKTASGAGREALTYLAEPPHIEPGLLPFDWYRDLVLAGALENRLAAAYVRRIEAVRVAMDTSPQRAARERRVLPRCFSSPSTSR